MKHLVDFILESAGINESVFGSQDWMKNNHTYAQDVINVLTSGKPLKLGPRGEDGEYFASEEEIEKLNQLTPDYTQSTLDQFNNIFGKKLKWTKIYKGTFSGKETETAGQVYESLVVYIFNGGTLYDEWMKSARLSSLDDSWVKSCEWTVEFMNKQKWAGVKWNNDEYVAVHVGGNNFGLDSKYEFAINISKIFKSKIFATKILGVDCSDIYGNSKDSWNKADIVLVKKDHPNIINDLKDVVFDGNSLNLELCNKLIDGIIIPISLKKITKKEDIHLNTVNIDTDEESKEYNFNNVFIQLANKYEDNKLTGDVNIVCDDGVRIVFRKTTGSGNALNVEPNVKNGKNVHRAGKAVENMKKLLHLKKGNDYYIFKNTDEEVFEELKNYGFEVDIPSRSNYNEVTPPIRKRACAAGLLGMLKQYKDKMHPIVDNDFPIDFAKFCFACSIKGTGAYLKIS